MQNSPASSHNPFPSSSTPNSFMDTFDFGNSDFSTANSGIEDLNIFPSSNTAPSSNRNAQSEAGSAPVSHHPSPSANFSHVASEANTQSHPASSSHTADIYLNSNSHASSPLAFSRNRFDNNSSASPQGSASNHAGGSEHGHNNRPLSGAASDMNFAGNNNFVDQNHAAAPAMQTSHSTQSQNNNGEQEGQMPQLSIGDLQQMLLERERTERIQNMQTALLKQQLDQLSRLQHQQQQRQHQQHQQHQQQQQQMQGPNAWQQHQQMNGAQSQPGAPVGDQSVLAQYGLITPMGSGPFNSSACPPGSANFMSPLTIQPNSQPGSVGVEHRPSQDYLGNYTPLESPAVTPASVFSTGSTGIVMSELFSPLTSPALGPQPPSLGEMMLPPAQLQHHQQSAIHGSPAIHAVNNFTPIASPLALIAKGSSKIRKNRSTTAEARANKVRPSPLIKPVPGPSIKNKKKDAASLASPSTATPLANGNGFANGGGSGPSSRRASITAAPAGEGSHSRHQSTEAGQSEGTSSTPSPIDLTGGGAMPPPSGPTNKIVTPSSIMGIRSSPGSSANSPNNNNGRGPAPLSYALKGKARDDFQAQQAQQMMMQQQAPAPMGMPSQPPTHQMYPSIAPFPTQNPGNGPKVTFNLPPNHQMGGAGMPNIQPNPLSQADRDAWMSYKSAGGLESRRTSHKAAEQKRRDSLKFCFDELRGLLPAITLDEDAPNGSLLGPDGVEEDREAEHFDPAEVGDPEMARSANKAISKVALLRHSNEYLVRLKKRLERRDQALLVCRKEIQDLKEKLGLPMSDDPSITGRGAPLSWTDDMMMGYELNMGVDPGSEAVSPEDGRKMDQS